MTSTVQPRGAVTIIGAGFGGICMGIKLRRAGIPFTILEKVDGVGGVWRDNTYPGAACDIPSHLYSYSFEPSHDWSRKYGTQPEIESYIDHCARKYGVLERIRFGQEVIGARFDEKSAQWRIDLAGGEQVASQFLVAATGQLSLPADPRLPGLNLFSGKVFHSARWDHDYDLRQVHQPAHRRVHPTSSPTANSAFRLRILQSEAPNTQVSPTQRGRRTRPATMHHEAGDRIRVQTNQPVRQHKSLYSGVISQPDVFALHANNQLTPPTYGAIIGTPTTAALLLLLLPLTAAVRAAAALLSRVAAPLINPRLCNQPPFVR